jgi:hypothetical protein
MHRMYFATTTNKRNETKLIQVLLLAQAKDEGQDELTSGMMKAVEPLALSVSWWTMRSTAVHVESLMSGDEAPSLWAECEQAYGAMPTPEFLGSLGDNHEVAARFSVEHAIVSHKHGKAKKAKEYLEEARGMLDLKVSLTGVLGKRTKFQRKANAQLVVLASSARTAIDEPKPKVVDESASSNKAKEGGEELDTTTASSREGEDVVDDNKVEPEALGADDSAKDNEESEETPEVEYVSNALKEVPLTSLDPHTPLHERLDLTAAYPTASEDDKVRM